MNDQEKQFLFDLLRTPSPSGWELPGQRIWAAQVRRTAGTVDTDAYGNAWGILPGEAGDACRIMLEAHADEIGLIVQHIDDKGFVSVSPLGGSDRTLAAARRIRIFGDKGEIIGIIGNTAVHLRDTKKDTVHEWKEHYVDIGASSADAVSELGIRVGHPAVYCDQAEELPSGRVVGRAIDNRISGFLISRVLAELAEGPRPYATTIALNAVQEEIGSFGVRMAAHRLNPTLALCFDVTHATDTPGINAKEHGMIKLGHGPTVAHGMANHPLVVQRLVEIAAREDIAIQHEAISRCTRTDTDQIYITREGIPSALVSIPLRYMHSPTELVDLGDVENAVRLVTAFVRSITAGDQFFPAL